jgi:DNA mismatch endonuclease, patch repair protein
VADVFTKQKRSDIMSRIRGRDTRPELLLRSLLKTAGVSIRRHVKSLPGTPEVVIPGSKVVLFVHGCFWHGHARCSRSNLPASNRKFWLRKVTGNGRRDRRQARALRRLGWRVGVFWTCKRLDADSVRSKLSRLGIEL